MVRVLHVIDSLGNGGTEHQLTAMLTRSDPHRFQHTVCALGRADWYSATIRSAGISVNKLNRIPRRQVLRTLRDLRALVRKVDPDVVHTSLYWGSVLGRAAAHFAAKPVVTTLVSTPYEPEWQRDNPRLTPLKVAVTRWLDSATANRWGTWFVAVTEAVRASAVKQLGLSPDRISVIPRGLELESFSPDPDGAAALRAELGWTGAFPVLLSVGRLVPEKGHRYAIEAMPKIVEAFPRALLVLVGGGRLRRELEEFAWSLGVGDQVSLLGERRDVPALLRAADLFIFPSLFEGTGGALLEALGAGLPSIVSRIPSLFEVTDNGRKVFLIEPRASDALADAVIRLGTDRVLAARLGQEAAAWVRHRYDITASTRKFEMLFDALASGRRIAAGEITLGVE